MLKEAKEIMHKEPKERRTMFHQILNIRRKYKKKPNRNSEARKLKMT